VLFHLRHFQPADFTTLWRIDQECFTPGISYSREELNYYIHRAGSFTLVAEADSNDGEKDSDGPDRIIGFVVAESAKGIGHIITIDVRAQVRRFGVGSALMDEAERLLRDSQCRRIYLETAVDNTGALAFYKRRGYELVKTRRRYYSNGVDALVLRKSVASRDTSA